MAFIDLKSAGRKWEVPSDLKEERAHKFRENYFLAADGFSLPLRVSSVRAAVQRQLQNQELLLLGSVSVHGLCSADLSRESARHPGLPASNPLKALSCGHSRQSVPKQYGGIPHGHPVSVYFQKALRFFRENPVFVQLRNLCEWLWRFHLRAR
jgi:hypothetical protein